MKNKKTKFITANALLMAIIVIMSLVPFLGFLQIGNIAITFVHIPVIIGAILFGYKSALLLSFTFGISSMFVAITRGSASDVLFTNPLVSVVPRILFGILTVAIYMIIKRLVKNEDVQTGATGFLASLAHSACVIPALMIAIGFTGEWNVAWGLLTAALLTNMIVEAIVATIVTVPVVKASRKVLD